MSVVVRAPEAADEAAWRQLWAGYNDFYNADVPEEVTAPYLEAGCSIPPRPSSVSSRKRMAVGRHGALRPSRGHLDLNGVCYLEDLYVDPAARGGGVGRAILDHLVAHCRAQGWSDLYWPTRDNQPDRPPPYDSYVAV